ncbi:type II secretion system minor pseudopilin GspI [Alteromonas sp. MYP5]|uniref:Type II secretion system protein I n=2 Tax=Alteromonas ponticola TaxID=2720613 RepID=A0ABX1R2U2_9ALTE|nr:type II secretion system minor pseudopilin GspI [Alteromonas ponticola]
MTLLEVMVALLIFAITGTAVMKAASDHLFSVGQIEEITFATWVANNRLHAIQRESTWPPKNNEKGQQEMSDRIWYWQQKVIQTSDKDLRAIEVSVGLNEDFSNSLTTVTSYVAKPAQND